MVTYYLYRLQNSLTFDKCGATLSWNRRYKVNKTSHGTQCVITLLETMEGPNTPEYWQVVGDREWELADQYGYRKGEHYRTIRIRGLKGVNANLTKNPNHMNSMRISVTLEHIQQQKESWKANGNKMKVTDKHRRDEARRQRHLTFEQAAEIRSKYIPRKYTNIMLAKEYKVHISTIKGIVQNNTYLNP